MKIALKMTGCKNNRYELDQILSWAIKSKVPVVREEEADFCIVNTCTVTHVADKKSRQMVRKTKNANPKLKTIVFGCGARMQKESFEEIGEVDYLMEDLPSVIGFLEEKINDKTRRRAIDCAPSGMEFNDFSRSRALVQVQDGCDNFCTYCIIVSARGRSRNRPLDEIIDEINKHVKNGYNEVVLTGINIGAYGASSTTKPEESKFAELLRTILDKTDIKRIRISSLGPEYFSDELYKVLKNPRICRHIHLSIQSGSSSVLKRMKRQYDAKDTEKVVNRLKNDISGIAITTDIIVGFPEESDEEFKETLDFVKKNPLAKAHVFPYSVRKNTLAAKMEQVPDEVKKERAKKLQKLADRQREDFIKSQTLPTGRQVGKKVSVLWESENEGLTDNYIRVQKKGDHEVRSITIEKLTEKMILK
ncbi:tRNA (N(6)-L-threonylcarbamoyladenosine(37)-C(2))-methylthiotransferase MtaB [Patescibacteria group bacterium]|nr:tRNA (N(6)-L-threonylcarbamoyladenosine(37)-C(2))-methylthiotransferase MtaB [Patescibacteria group bacterium]MBU1683758.1 tRNA (N(6)-L-threonylcarbamoyladenosine(37)-C(2))-methylthiotransferase MtaB [Patescibacteria group bacterium]